MYKASSIVRINTRFSFSKKIFFIKNAVLGKKEMEGESPLISFMPPFVRSIHGKGIKRKFFFLDIV